MEEKRYTIYMHRNKINNKVYIGQTSRDMMERWKERNYGYNDYFRKSINKYGSENFDHIILHENLSRDEANEYEQFYISKYNSMNKDYGYNVMPGGHNTEFTLENYTAFLEKTRITHNKKIVGRNIKTLEFIYYNSITDAAKDIGICVSAISNNCNKRIKSAKGYVWRFIEDKDELTDDFVRNIHTVSEETRDKLKKANAGFYPEDAIKAKSRAVKGTNIKTGEIVFFDTCSAAEKYFNIATSNVSQVCKGKKHSAKGYIWEYINE